MFFPPRLARFSSTHLIVLAVGLACLTSWATFTGYTAKQNRAGQEKPRRLSGSTTDSVSGATLNTTYGNMPLSFEANRGQTDSAVNYVARGPGYNIFLTPAEAVLVFAGKNSKGSAAETQDAGEGGFGGVKMTPLANTIIRTHVTAATEQTEIKGMGQGTGDRAAKDVAERLLRWIVRNRVDRQHAKGS